MHGLTLPYGANIYAGQRFYGVTNDAWNPVAVGSVRSTVPAPIPTVAPMNSGPSLTRYDVGMSAGGAKGAGSIPWIVIGALIASLLILRYIHFRG